jgi:Nuclease-related domain
LADLALANDLQRLGKRPAVPASARPEEAAMRVFYGESHYPTDHDGFRTGAAATLILLATAVFAIAADPVGIAALSPAAALAAHQGLKQIKRWRRGNVGEWAIGNLLRDLSDRYYLVRNLTPIGRSHPVNVLIGPCGVLVIETRRIQGRILCYGGRWYVNGWRRRGFGKRLSRSASAIQRALQRSCPEESALLRRVEPLVVFTHPHCQLNVYRPRVLVARYPELLKLIWALERRHNLPADAARRLAEVVARAPADTAASGSSLKPAMGW